MSQAGAPIYLDHAAATPVDPRVLDVFVDVERRCAGNPASLHAAGRAARQALESARGEAAHALGVPANGVWFVSGGTEANVTIVRGSGVVDRPVLLAPAIEHPSVAAAAERWRGVVGWAVTPDGRAAVVDPEAPIGLVCLAHAQSEIGTVQPVEAAAAVARRAGVPLHVDASQTLGRLPLTPVLAAADTVALSAHKAGGLRGCTVLVAPRGAVFAPLLVGGGHERGRRAGTPSPGLAAATARAIRLAVEERAERAAAMAAARAALVAAVRAGAGPGAVTVVGGDGAEHMPNIATLCFERVDGRALLPALDLLGVHASQGTACSSGSPEPPLVLRSMGMDVARSRRCVRFSVSHRTTLDEVREAARRIVSAVVRLATLDARGS